MLVELEVLSIGFYEGDYQFKSKQVIKPNKDSRLFDDISRELDNQMNYRVTDKSLWATISDEYGGELFRVVRIKDGLLNIKNHSNPPSIQECKYMSLERAELVEVGEYK